MLTIPIDSTDAREQREAERDQAEHDAAQAGHHAAACRRGWLGEDSEGRPIPCTRCRPHLAHVACPTCSTPYAACQSQLTQRRGPCCPLCRHLPSSGGDAA